MVFVSRIPPTGFAKKPTDVFVYDPLKKLTTASTCDLQLRLPLCHGTDYETFKQNMVLSIKGNDGFGGP